jgi:excisionase family DNA binding protein
MTGLSLREAAKEAGVSKSTILRAVKAGRLSAARTDDGGYCIDPAELFRVYTPESRATRQEQLSDTSAGQGASAEAMAELRIQAGVLEAQLQALKEVLAGERRRAEEIREDRERWHTQADRLALMAPAKSAPAGRAAETASQPRFGWLKMSLLGGSRKVGSAA